MDTQTAVSVVDHLSGGDVVVVGVHGVAIAVRTLGPSGAHLSGGLLHEGDVGVLGVGLVISAVAPGIQDALDAGVQGGHGVHGGVVQEALDGLDLGLGSGGFAAGGPGVLADLTILIAIGLDVVAVPLIVEGAVHVDGAGARIIAQDTILVPVGAFHTELSLGVDGAVGVGAVQGGDKGIAVDIGVGVAEGNAVAVAIGGPQVGTVIIHEGLLIAVGVHDGHDVNHIVLQNILDIGGVGVEEEPPGGVHGGGSALALAAVDVGDDADAGLVLLLAGVASDLQAPQVALLPGGADGIQVSQLGIGLSHGGQLLFQLGKGVTVVPVDLQGLGDILRSAGDSGVSGLCGGAGDRDQHDQDQGQTKQPFQQGLFHHSHSFLIRRS